MQKFIAVFEDKRNKERRKEIEADSLEDATIEASNIADRWEWELLAVDYEYNIKNLSNQ